jgi:methyl-accepting chemotaxis protein
MVALQTEAVNNVIEVFHQMREHMGDLVNGLKEIVVSTEKADGERSATVDAVQNIASIIEETASNAATVNDIAFKLLEKVNDLNHTADVLSGNMDGLKSEISVFKV